MRLRLNLGGVANFRSSPFAPFFACGMISAATNGLAACLLMEPRLATPVDRCLRGMNEAEMIEAVTKGMGKMTAYKDSLTASQIKASVVFFRRFLKVPKPARSSRRGKG